MPFRTTVLFLVFIVGMVPQARGLHDAPRQILGACVAFAPDGTSAAVSIDANSILLEIVPPSGKISQLSKPLYFSNRMAQLEGGASYACDSYVDLKSELVALGIASRFPTKGQLQVAVADLKTLTWIGNWVVGPESGFYSPSLAGFFDGTASLAVSGERAKKDGGGIEHGSFATLLFDPTGKQLKPMPTTRIYAHETDVFPTYADALHNRLWFFQCEMVSAPASRQPLCPVGSVSLAGDEPAFSEFTPTLQGQARTDLWFLPHSFAAPDSDTVLVAEGNTLWHVDMRAHTVDRLVLPKRTHFPNSEGAYIASAISPDGQIIAVPLNLHALRFPYLADNYVYKGTDIAVIRVRPLQLLGILPHEGTPGPVAFAVDHHQEKVTILVYRRNHWDRRELDARLKP
jgi:hypothetical protein